MKLLPLVFSAAFADKNGGATCAACGIIGGWLEQYGSANGKSGSETIADMCRFLPTDLERGKIENGYSDVDDFFPHYDDLFNAKNRPPTSYSCHQQRCRS